MPCPAKTRVRIAARRRAAEVVVDDSPGAVEELDRAAPQDVAGDHAALGSDQPHQPQRVDPAGRVLAGGNLQVEMRERDVELRDRHDRWSRLSVMPITAGPYSTSLFQRIGPANRTAKPLSVVLPQWILMADDQGASLAGLGKQQRRPALRRHRHRPVEHERAAQPVGSRRERHRSESIDEALKVVARPGGGVRRLGRAGPLGRVAASAGKLHDRASPVGRDEPERHRALALVAIGREEHVDRLASGRSA